jgi:hypothetical protein
MPSKTVIWVYVMMVMMPVFKIIQMCIKNNIYLLFFMKLRFSGLHNQQIIFLHDIE